MSDRSTIVIVGGGLAGAAAVAELRAAGFDGRVRLVGAEPGLPYERPPLSKDYLAGNSTLADAEVHDEAFYVDHAIDRIEGEAVRLDPAERRVALGDGTALRYGQLLLATGAAPRRPPIPGADLPGVRLLRTVQDSDALRAVLGTGQRLAIIGAGWIGCEVAATARGLGAEVTVIEAAATPLAAVLGEALGAGFAALHRDHGVELLTEARVRAIEPGMRVTLGDGGVVECDAVLLAVGVAPCTGLAADAGLELDGGVAADAFLRTSAPDVFVAGDVAAAQHPRYGRRVRVEHWDNAREQGAAAARAMVGAGAPYERLPYFFSDQYDLGLEYVGRHDGTDALVVRGDPAGGPFQAVWLGADGRVTAAMHGNDWDAMEPLRALVEAGARLDPGRLRDPEAPLAGAGPVERT